MAPVQRGLYLSGQPLDHEPSLGQVPVVSLAAGASPPSDAWLPPTHQFARLRYGAPPMPPPPPPPLDRQSPGSLAAVMQGIPVPPATALSGPPPYPADMACDGVADALQFQQAGPTPNSAAAAAAGRVEVF